MPLPAGIIDLATHPPFGWLTNVLDTNGPYGPGSHSLTTWNDSGTTRGVQDSMGVIAIINGSIPAGLGFTFGWDGSPGPLFDGHRYQSRMIQIVVQHQLLLGLGGYVNTQIEEQFRIAELHLWDIALPGRLGLYVAPSLHFDLQFLRAL